jgi:hypothetical protein
VVALLSLVETVYGDAVGGVVEVVRQKQAPAVNVQEERRVRIECNNFTLRVGKWDAVAGDGREKRVVDVGKVAYG